MIDFTCPRCRTPFTLPDQFAGRAATCRTCQAPLAVPAPADAANPAGPNAPPGARLPPRTRRLMADAELVRRAFANSALIKVRPMHGDPPEAYQVEYFLRGLERVPGRREPVERHAHAAEIRLGLDYPRLAPHCRMLTPVFHPNIEPATICAGDHWTAGERLADLIIRIGEMIAYQAYNIQSPLDAEAAMWADLNLARLPIDNRNLRPPELD